MPLELINTIAGLLTVTIVAAAALAALAQLRHLNAANQINALMNVEEKLNGGEFIDAMTDLNDNLDAAMADPQFRAYEVAISRRLPRPAVSERYAELHRNFVLVGNTFELLGMLVKNRIVDPNTFVDAYCWVVLGAWRRLADTIALNREAANPNFLEHFEHLAVLSEDRLNSNTPSYPKGTRRYPLRNPWPLE